MVLLQAGAWLSPVFGPWQENSVFEAILALVRLENKTMKHCKKFTLMALLGLALSPAYAAMVPTAQFNAEPERAQLIINVAQRQQVELELIELGVDRAEAIERVSQMTDEQIAGLQGKITELPAGGLVGTIELLLIVLIVILLV